MKYLKLLIERKTKVPTKHQRVHLYRSDWRKIRMIDYSESTQMFSFGKGIIETDAQFCKWLKDNYGNGIYLVIAWRKGRKGFWNFMKVELDDKKFRRLQRNPTPDELEIKQEMQQIKALERKKINQSSSERDHTESDIEFSQDYIKEIKKDIKNTKSGCYPYLKSMQPIYSWHSYEDYRDERKFEEVKERLV